MRTSITVIIDEYGDVVSQATAARMLGLTQPSLRTKLSVWRRNNPGISVIHLASLQVPLKSVEVIDDRFPANRPQNIPIVALVKLCEVSRTKVIHAISKYQAANPGLPIRLKEFITEVSKDRRRGSRTRFRARM